MSAWRRLLALLGLARTKPPEPDRTNVIDLGEERVRRYGVMLVGYVTERDAREARSPAEVAREWQLWEAAIIEGRAEISRSWRSPQTIEARALTRRGLAGQPPKVTPY